MKDKPLTLYAVGDLILDEPDPESFFIPSAPILRSGDVVTGQVEVVFTSRPVNTYMEPPAPPCKPEHMKALKTAGFNVATLAGNHLWDSGEPGIEDTIAGLAVLGIEHVGAGKNLNEARKPVLIERNGIKFGFLNFNCVGPKQTWATSDKPGCAYVHILTFYESPYGTPGFPPVEYSFAEPGSLRSMQEDIRELRHSCDVLIVVFHKGVSMPTPELAMYEQPVSHAAIDAGADLVLSQHAHILRGVEIYKGKAIFHGLCNFVAVTRAITKSGAKSHALRKIVREREKYYGISEEPECPVYPFHPEARKTIIAKCLIDDGKITRVGYIPCWINQKGQPEIHGNDKKGRDVYDYMTWITEEAGLNAIYSWDGDEVIIKSK